MLFPRLAPDDTGQEKSAICRRQGSATRGRLFSSFPSGRISKTVSFTVYFHSGTAIGHSRGSLRSLFAEPLSHIMGLIDAQSVVAALVKLVHRSIE